VPPPRRRVTAAAARGGQLLRPQRAGTGPLLPPEARVTYAIVRPRQTHARPASCAEVACSAWLRGWRTTVDEATDLGRGQAAWVRGGSGRRFTESRDPAGLTVFEFPPEQTCFRAADHRAAVQRPPLFVVRDGDRRGNPRRTRPRVHRNAEDWRDDFGAHQETLADRLRQG
jgi:hypothetical protein